MSSDVILQPREEIEPPSTRAEDDPRRAGSVVVSLRSDGNCTLTVDGEMWGAVEWSEKQGTWCIEDAEGRCLRHTASIRGKAASREEAVALAEQMVRDGTMPTPEEARRLHRERLGRQREERAKQPAEIRKAQEREEVDRLLMESFKADRAESQATPFYEIFAESFDLADPDLWRSNSFAMLRPRLLVEVRSAIAHLEYEIAHACRPRKRWGSRTRIKKSDFKPNPEHVRKLARAREILALIDDGSGRP